MASPFLRWSSGLLLSSCRASGILWYHYTFWPAQDGNRRVGNQDETNQGGCFACCTVLTPASGPPLGPQRQCVRQTPHTSSRIPSSPAQAARHQDVPITIADDLSGAGHGQQDGQCAGKRSCQGQQAGSLLIALPSPPSRTSTTFHKLPSSRSWQPPHSMPRRPAGARLARPSLPCRCRAGEAAFDR